MRRLLFDAHSDVVFDAHGVTVIPSGTAAYDPARPRIVVSQTRIGDVPAAEQAACAAAAGSWLDLALWVTAHFDGQDERSKNNMMDAVGYEFYCRAHNYG